PPPPERDQEGVLYNDPKYDDPKIKRTAEYKRIMDWRIQYGYQVADQQRLARRNEKLEEAEAKAEKAAAKRNKQMLRDKARTPRQIRDLKMRDHTTTQASKHHQLLQESADLIASKTKRSPENQYRSVFMTEADQAILEARSQSSGEQECHFYCDGSMMYA
ncbi:hypothetical protein BGX28_002585, partial [Mortierella sp. GBA30]